jgi:hypothetical protein
METVGFGKSPGPERSARACSPMGVEISCPTLRDQSVNGELPLSSNRFAGIRM